MKRQAPPCDFVCRTVAGKGKPLSETLIDTVCASFALWTVCSHINVALELSLWALIVTFLISGLVLTFLLPRLPGWKRQTPDRRCHDSHGDSTDNVAYAVRWIGVVVAVASVLVLIDHKDVFSLWISMLTLAALAAYSTRTELQRAHDRANTSRKRESALWALAIFCAVVALIAHRPDIDDTFYVNMAVAAAQEPSRALLSGDTLHGIKDLPLHLPVYRTHSYELLVGAISLTTQIPPIYGFHWLLAGIAALLVPFAHASLFKTLAPRHWFWSTIVLLVVLVAIGETHRWYGNFSLVRMWQGKALFLSIFLPLTYTYALRFSFKPAIGTWLLLSAAQISAIGCSSSALWSIPIASAIGLLSAAPWSSFGLRRVALGMCASLYVLLTAYFQKISISDRFAVAFSDTERLYPQASLAALFPSAFWMLALGALLMMSTRIKNISSSIVLRSTLVFAVLLVVLLPVRTHPWSSVGSVGYVQWALTTTLGSAHVWAIGVFAVLVAWSVSPDTISRRFAAVSCCATAAFLLNPFAALWIRDNMTGPAFWRVMWAVPIPILIALMLASPTGYGRTKFKRILGWLLSALLLFLVASKAPKFAGLSEENRGLWLGRPSLKVDRPEYYWAQRLNELTPPGSVVAAPPLVSAWIPVTKEHRFPLVVRHYLRRHKHILGMEDLDLRVWMTEATAGEQTIGDEDRPRFSGGLEAYDVSGICLKHSDRTEPIQATLKESGFRRVEGDEDYEIWMRFRPQTHR